MSSFHVWPTKARAVYNIVNLKMYHSFIQYCIYIYLFVFSVFFHLQPTHGTFAVSAQVLQFNSVFLSFDFQSKYWDTVV